MTNAELGGFVAELADLMALNGADRHRVSHYRRAATAIRRFDHSLAALIEGGADLSQVPGIGKGLAGYLGDLVRDGMSPRLERYRGRVPAGVRDLLRLDGIGVTRARALRDAGVDSVAKLGEALANGELRGVGGFGPAVLGRVQRGLAAMAALSGKSLLSEADRAVGKVLASLRGAGLVAEVAGEVRRRLEIVGAVDIVCAADPEALWTAAGNCPGATISGTQGGNPVEASVDGVRARLWALPRGVIGAVAHHLTGPTEYLDALEERARAKGLDLTPAGLNGTEGANDAEDAIYTALGLPWIPPELREDAATLARADRGLPRVVERGDIKGDLHMHTTWSDGTATVRRMVQAAVGRGYQYVAITDHSPSTGVVAGVDAAGLRAQAAEIARVQEDHPGLRILRGCEVDILPDGTLDLDDEILSELDVVLASVHSVFDMTAARMTDRIIRAMENPFVDVLGHLTGRKLGRRASYPVDVGEILRAAHHLDVAVEVNGSPRRLDLDHRGLSLCGELGVGVVVSSDAHSVTGLDNVNYAVDQARRGWLQSSQIVNTGTLDEVSRWIGRRRG
ncbi:MAG: PHP domain-containing protein [Gemmatimonadota bacterium]|nr:PHP domain-containing protein [Gemmatimonadota bacterium]